MLAKNVKTIYHKYRLKISFPIDQSLSSLTSLK